MLEDQNSSAGLEKECVSGSSTAMGSRQMDARNVWLIRRAEFSRCAWEYDCSERIGNVMNVDGSIDEDC